ncbi:methyltransferase domain-containing protein [Streptomyces diacarni]|uniref:Methyltransferase domain-containing protein n=1 Tax=Streptomyces diacarni TaxID=2800381 RepID=A0A367FDF6_9ACTN|nr:methyltransferase domain-containing protein [Streptomyces diacarni]RCG28413.1 methyltransferase domain-containing protein [Streptomyces diacarni]
MTDSAQTLPEPEAVGALYDRLTRTALNDGTFNPNIHIGFWETPDSEATLEEAVDTLTDVLIERLLVDGSHHVLDLGCGVGGPALRVTRQTGARVTGVSISQEQVKTANRLAEEAGLADRAVFEHGDAMHLPFEDGSFDAVMALESIIHMPDRQQVLTEAARVLKPGGRLVLTDIFERAPRKEVPHPSIQKFCRNFMVTLADADDYVALLHRSGLRLRGLLDITEHTQQRTFRELARPTAEEDRPEALGQTNLPDLFRPADMLGVEEFGCLLAAAVRP